MMMPDHIVGVFFYVVARKTEAERHVWSMVDRDGVLAQNGLGSDLLARWEVMHVKVQFLCILIDKQRTVRW
jgi:hypothetical protein